MKRYQFFLTRVQILAKDLNIVERRTHPAYFHWLALLVERQTSKPKMSFLERDVPVVIYAVITSQPFYIVKGHIRCWSCLTAMPYKIVALLPAPSPVLYALATLYTNKESLYWKQHLGMYSTISSILWKCYLCFCDVLPAGPTITEPLAWRNHTRPVMESDCGTLVNYSPRVVLPFALFAIWRIILIPAFIANCT